MACTPKICDTIRIQKSAIRVGNCSSVLNDTIDLKDTIQCWLDNGLLTVPNDNILASTPTYGEKIGTIVPITVINTIDNTETTQGTGIYVFKDADNVILGTITGDLSTVDITTWTGDQNILDNVSGTPQELYFDYGTALSNYPINSEDIIIETFIVLDSETSSNYNNEDVTCLSPSNFLLSLTPVESSLVSTVVTSNRTWIDQGDNFYSEFDFVIGDRTGKLYATPAVAAVNGVLDPTLTDIVFFGTPQGTTDNGNELIPDGGVGSLRFVFDNQVEGFELDLFFDNTGVGISNVMVDNTPTGFTNVDGLFDVIQYGDLTYSYIAATGNDQTGRANVTTPFTELSFDVFKPSDLIAVFEGMRFKDCNNSFATVVNPPNLITASPYDVNISYAVTPSSGISPNTDTAMRWIVDAKEILGAPTDNLVEVRIPKTSNFTFTWNPTSTSEGGVTVNNAAWTFDDTDPTDWIWTKPILNSNEISTFGMVGTWNSATGIYTLDANISSQGETYPSNNQDQSTVNVI